MATQPHAPGRSCPLSYSYGARALNQAPSFRAETLYVAGGLYGNRFALSTILDMAQKEERKGPRVTLCFNGDFNWFNASDPDFRQINTTVLEHLVVKGNVEAELAEPSPEGGCGCNYPDYIDDGVVASSNAIFEKLQRTAARNPDIVSRLKPLPMFLTAAVGDRRVGIVHGDPESLAGWSLAVEAMPDPDTPLSTAFASPEETRRTTRQTIEDYFRQANVSVFASSHTCLPYAQDFTIDGSPRVVINNGSAGMPNFRGTRFGLIARISVDPRVPRDSLFGIQTGPLRCDAVAVQYRHDLWLQHFLRLWPEGTPAHVCYYARMAVGPAFDLSRAARGRVRASQSSSSLP